jgi:hypothetical protein
VMLAFLQLFDAKGLAVKAQAKLSASCG